MWGAAAVGAAHRYGKFKLGDNTMTRKDYIAIANVFHERKPVLEECAGKAHYAVMMGMWIVLMRSMRDMLTDNNSNFNPTSFVEACGYEQSNDYLSDCSYYTE